MGPSVSARGPPRRRSSNQVLLQEHTGGGGIKCPGRKCSASEPGTRWAAQPDPPLEAGRGAWLFPVKPQGQEVAGQRPAHRRGSASVCRVGLGAAVSPGQGVVQWDIPRVPCVDGEFEDNFSLGLWATFKAEVPIRSKGGCPLLSGSFSPLKSWHWPLSSVGPHPTR